MYELFVLGELVHKPMHGYLLQRVVQEAIGPVRQMSWGALYPLLRRLEREGLIARAAPAGEGAGEGDDEAKRFDTESNASESSSGRARKRYRITSAGESRFQQLMAQPGAYDGDYPDLFTLKLSNFYQIDHATRLAVLQHYHGFILYIQDYLLASRQHIDGEPAIPEVERPSILLALDHRLHVAPADLAWLDAEIAHLAGEPDRL